MFLDSLLLVHEVTIAFAVLQIADFGMSRDLDDADYYLSNGGKIPFKWTAPEVSYIHSQSSDDSPTHSHMLCI